MMLGLRNLIVILVLVGTQDPLMAEKGQTGLAVQFGEAFGFSDIRVTVDDFDFGWQRLAGLYFGPRYWKGHYYLGVGPGINTSVNLYGVIGFQWEIVNFEFFAAGNFYNSARALGQIGVGIYF